MEKIKYMTPNAEEIVAEDCSFKEYIEIHFKDSLADILGDYVREADPGGLDLRLNTFAAVEKVELCDCNIDIQWVSVFNLPGTRIRFYMPVIALLSVVGYDWNNRPKTIETKQWFEFSCEGRFKFNFTDEGDYNTLKVTVKDISVYYRKDRDGQALADTLVPFIRQAEYEDKATEFLREYYPEALEKPMPIDLEKLTYNMSLSVISDYLITLDGTVFGQIFFQDAVATVYDRETLEKITIGAPAGTILVDPDIYDQLKFGTCNNTIVHECVHWWLHWKAAILRSLFNRDSAQIRCRVGGENYVNDCESLRWMERHANGIAPKILIPFKTGIIKFKEILKVLEKTAKGYSKAEIMEKAVAEFADFFQVSIAAAKIRARELGFEQVAGVYNFVNGRYCPPFWFKQGMLGKNQTFTIDRENAIFASLTNPEFEKDMFIYAEGVFVINDPKYVNIEEDREPFLTDYARNHVDECCLVFKETFQESNKRRKPFGTACSLSRDVDSRGFVEASYNPNEGENEDVVKRAREMHVISSESKRLQAVFANLPATFAGTLDYHIIRKGYTNEKLEERSLISSRMIQDYRNGKAGKPSLPSVLALGIGLNLQPMFFYDLIAKAGYNIMTINGENLIYQFLIANHHMENIHMWNDKLREAGIKQKLPKNGNKLIN